MHLDTRTPRKLGTMIVYRPADLDPKVDLAIAGQLGASLVEVLPEWSNAAPPEPLRTLLADHNLEAESVHGCWGGQSIRAPRVDLGSTDAATYESSLDDLKRCADWAAALGARVLVIHPGGLSDAEEKTERTEVLARGLLALADHVSGTGLTVCVENMPHGVYPGSRMADLASLVSQLNRPELGLTLDTGHARITSTPENEAHAAGLWLRSTHVHDNDGRQDTHLPPGQGVVDWPAWARSLDAIGYAGPIMLECIRILRKQPHLIDEAFLARLAILTGADPAR